MATARAATRGFGYDPVFRPAEGDGRTFAEMSAAEKHAAVASRSDAGRRARVADLVASGLTDGRDRHRRVRRRPQGPRGRARVPRPRRAALRGELLAAPELGGRPPPRGGLRGPRRPLPLAARSTRGCCSASRTRCPGPGRGRGTTRRVLLPAELDLGAAAAAARTRPARAGDRARRGGRPRPAARGLGDRLDTRRPPTRPSGRCASSPTSGSRCCGSATATRCRARSSTAASL